MASNSSRSRRKASGGRYRSFKKKRLFSLARFPTLTKLAGKKSSFLRKKGGDLKQILLSSDTANVLDIKTKNFEQLKIESVLENPANRHFIRRNILTKGTIIKTSKGNARITSRPGQEGTVNAVLIK